MTKKTQQAVPALSESAVVEYLRENPDFFKRHEYLLAELLLPHPGIGPAVSLMERQVAILREREEGLKRKLQALAQVARGNEALLERMQRLILAVIDSPDLDACLSLLSESLKEDFHADSVAVRLIGKAAGQRPEFIAVDTPGLAAVDRLLSRRRPVCGYLSPEQLRFLFPEQVAEIASGAIIPLCESEQDTPIGLIGLGSVDPRRFHAEMGTVFLSHLGAIVTRVLRSRGG